jgi:hypothetical protein
VKEFQTDGRWTSAAVGSLKKAGAEMPFIATSWPNAVAYAENFGMVSVERLIPAMLERFIRADREFPKVPQSSASPLLSERRNTDNQASGPEELHSQVGRIDGPEGNGNG